MKTPLTTLLLCLAFSAPAQVFDIDLSKNDSKTETVEPGKTITVNLKNRLPLGAYKITIVRSGVPIPPIELPVNKEQKLDGKMEASSCDELKTAYQLLQSVTEETAIPTAYEKLAKAVKKITPLATCPDEVSLATALLQQTSSVAWTGQLNAGEQVEITISRSSGATEKKWTLILTTQPHGRWEISYGFNFITQWFVKEDLYYTKIDTAGGYVITKENNRRTVSYAPSIMFTYLPFDKDYHGWNFGISPGLGTDLESPIVFLSLTATFRLNFRIHAGVAYNQQYVLLGRYNENDVISEDLSREQLHEKQYMLNPFFAISIRFKENVFNR